MGFLAVSRWVRTQWVSRFGRKEYRDPGLIRAEEMIREILRGDPFNECGRWIRATFYIGSTSTTLKRKDMLSSEQADAHSHCLIRKIEAEIELHDGKKLKAKCRLFCIRNEDWEPEVIEIKFEGLPLYEYKYQRPGTKSFVRTLANTEPVQDGVVVSSETPGPAGYLKGSSRPDEDDSKSGVH